MSEAEERFRSTIRHFGIPRRDLDRYEYAERREDVQALSPEDRVLYDALVGRMFADQQHEAHRARRLAAGLPATEAAAKGRPSRFCDPESEPHWLAEAQRLGLDPGKSHTLLRLVARRLSDAATTELTRQAEKAAAKGHTPPETTDDDVLARFYRQDAKRWRRDAKRARLMAAQYDSLEDRALLELISIEKRLARVAKREGRS